MDRKNRVVSWLGQHSGVLRMVWKWCESMTMLALLVGGGAFGGYWVAYAQFREAAALMRTDHQAEIQRLQDTLTTVLTALAPQLADSAQQSAAAAKDAKVAATAAASAASAASAVPKREPAHRK